MMPFPTVTTAPPARHQWHMSFDRIACRDCGVEHTDGDDDALCKRAAKIRPIAGFRLTPSKKPAHLSGDGLPP